MSTLLEKNSEGVRLDPTLPIQDIPLISTVNRIKDTGGIITLSFYEEGTKYSIIQLNY